MKFPVIKFKPKQLKGLECLNCKQPLVGTENFCSYCGQKNSTKKLSFNVFINNLVSGFFSYDSRFWKTFLLLLTKPGKVSKDYIEGKRVRFVNPFQLYLNVSIIFFLLLGISNKMENGDMSNNILTFSNSPTDSLVDVGRKKLDTTLLRFKDPIFLNSSSDSTTTEVITDFNKALDLILKEKDSAQKEYSYHICQDSTNTIGLFKKLNDFRHYYSEHTALTHTTALDSLGYKKTFWNKFYYQQVINSNKNMEAFKADGGKAYFNKLLSYLSISLFVFLPIFTLFLKLIYIRRKFTYMENLVFVFHTQTVFFLLFILFYLLNFFVALENYIWVFILLFLLYLYKALRYFFQQGRFKTIVKFILLNSFYLFLGFIGFLIVGVISFMAS